MTKYQWLDEVFDTLDDLEDYARSLASRSMHRKIRAARATALLDLHEAKNKDQAHKPDQCRFPSSLRNQGTGPYMIWDASSQVSKVMFN